MALLSTKMNGLFQFSEDFSVTRQRVIKRLRTTKPIRPTPLLQALQPVQRTMELAVQHRLVPLHLPKNALFGKEVLFKARPGHFVRPPLNVLQTFQSFTCP